MRWEPLVGALLLVGCIAVAANAVGPAFYINESESMPKGLYLVRNSDAALKHGDVVVFDAPPEMMKFAVERGYIGTGMPFIKSVGAIAGDTFCVRWDDAERRTFIINDVTAGPVFAKDSKGRAMPRIEGCQRVKDGEFLPVGTGSKRSFDGRYWGALPISAIRGIPSLKALGEASQHYEGESAGER